MRRLCRQTGRPAPEPGWMFLRSEAAFQLEVDVEKAVWAVLEKALPAVLGINTRRFSVPGIMERYAEDPLLLVMALARVAGGLATAKPELAARTLMLAEESLPGAALGIEPLADMARSYVLRTKGTLVARRQGAAIDWASAEPLYQESLTIMPQNAAAAYLKGMVSFMRRGYTAAARLFATSLALDCDFAPAYSQLATCCLLLGDPAACITVSEALIVRHWRVAAGHQMLAAALYAQEANECGRDLKRRSRALEALGQAKKLQRGKSWGKEDDDMQAALACEEPVPKVPVRTWLFHTWRL